MTEDKLRQFLCFECSKIATGVAFYESGLRYFCKEHTVFKQHDLHGAVLFDQRREVTAVKNSDGG